MTLQFLPGYFRQSPNLIFQVFPGVIAKDEAYATILIPSVQVRSLGKIGIATEQYLAKATKKTGSCSSVELGGGTFMRRAITGAVDNAHHLARIGKAHEQRMVAPDAVVTDVNSFLVFGAGGYLDAIGVQYGFCEEVLRLLLPDLHANLIVDILKGGNITLSEPPAEITGSCWIRDTLSADGIQKIDVIATQFDILQAITIAQ